MAGPAVLHSLLWLQMVLHSSHLFQVALNSLLTLATSEYGVESSTLKQSSASTLVGTRGRRAGTARWIGGKLARLKLHGVAVLNSQLGLSATQNDIPDIFMEDQRRRSDEQPVDESYRRAWDGQLYTIAEFWELYGSYLGDAYWQNAQDEGEKDTTEGASNDELLKELADLRAREVCEQG